MSHTDLAYEDVTELFFKLAKGNFLTLRPQRKRNPRQSKF